MKFASATKLDRKSGGTWGTRPVLLLVKPCYDTDSAGTHTHAVVSFALNDYLRGNCCTPQSIQLLKL